ncbi:pilus assembly protein TadG-related protein [Streptomyces sp. NPDC051569]|uniref:pilus assembly protein TadG-related protein n=1 Tax=Streptomyces sp. NPDC051569 TaxID=3365661 RepID=UPI0037A5C6A3
MVRRLHETGQAAPIYITMVAGLLFLALAFFAVGQAGATRNGAQSAADAAALAAAQESRDAFLLGDLLDPGHLDDIFNGNPIGTADGCAAATRFADQNKADVDVDAGGCGRIGGFRWGFTVHVITQEPMGDSVLPGTGNEKARAQATAIVTSRCSFEPAEDEEEPSDGGDEDEPGDDKPVSPGELDCGGTKWPIDPEHLDRLPSLADLFSVRLAQD